MSRIDSYISLHFEDLPAAPAKGRENFVVAFDEPVQPVRRMRGVRGPRPADTRTTRTVRSVSATEAARMLDAGEARTVKATVRRQRIPVLLHLKRADWNRDIGGLEKGSRLGRILSAIATEEAIQELGKDPEVISVEASRSG